jgi:hypothetical protein
MNSDARQTALREVVKTFDHVDAILTSVERAFTDVSDLCVQQGDVLARVRQDPRYLTLESETRAQIEQLCAPEIVEAIHALVRVSESDLPAAKVAFRELMKSSR